jgi:CHASE2 domain-containing sensor protein
VRGGSSLFKARPFAPRRSALAAVAASLVGVGVGLAVVFAPLLGGLEQQTLGPRFSLRSTPRPNDLAVVAIDDRSFALLRHPWPFPRSWHGRVLEQLHRAGARAIFYDVQFTEPSTPSEDGALFDALGRTGGAVLATTDTDGYGHTNVLGGDANLARATSRAAASAFPVDTGGVIDRVPYELGGLTTAAVSIATRLDGRLPRRSLFDGGGAYIDYRGGPSTFRTVSFADVLEGKFAANAFRGKVVVVGATSPTLQDQHATPVASHSLMSGPEVQANAIWTVLHGVPLRPLPIGWDVILVLLAAALAPLTRLRRSVGGLVLLVFIAVAGYLILDQALFDAGFIAPVVGPLAALAAAALATVLASHVLVNAELRATQLEVVQRLARAAESRDEEIGRHLDRMSFLCEQLALAAGLGRRDAKLLRQASALHDVGKIGIPDEVLMKPSRLDDRERDVMKTHADLGASMLAGSSTRLLQLAEVVALTHHERWDGKGYPNGLSAEAIPLAGRICAICDVFDALLSRRRYKEQWSLGAALHELERGAGSQFDPHLTKLFIEIAPRLYRELARTVDPDLTHAVAPAELPASARTATA